MTITIWKSGFTVPDIAGEVYSRNRVCYRGEVVTLTPEQVEMTKDRAGNSWLDLTEEAQESKWGAVRFRHGDHSAEVAFIGDDDSTVRYRRRENAVQQAQKIADAAERKAEFARINSTYGHAQSTQRSQAY
ncbi:hypothetical protein LG322_08455 [Microbacterium aerolatum]|uniref:hypothetical protein n=1 Tax=Microbacterium aerolatum TaxID=153731 RepID=UPI00384B1A9C